MKAAFTLFLAANVLGMVTGTPVANAHSGSTKQPMSWSAQRLAIAPTYRGETFAPAERRDIQQLESRWNAGLLTAQQPSVLPEFFAQQGISVHRGDSHGPFIGFLAANKIVKNRKAATKYSIAEPHLPSTQIDVLGTSLQMCVAVGPFGEYIGPSVSAFHFARHAPAGAGKSAVGPHWVEDLQAFVMTSAFSLNQESREISVQWINPDAASPRTMIAMAYDRVFYTGDIAAFEQVLGSKPEIVAFNWVEI
ncbi:hypothetical protein C8R43DRAFT_1152180 [Mycena crocata]|nr:hypothetical protein C8R43DRAFT_1152180 [Mycena crocata]